MASFSLGPNSLSRPLADSGEAWNMCVGGDMGVSKT